MSVIILRRSLAFLVVIIYLGGCGYRTPRNYYQVESKVQSRKIDENAIKYYNSGIAKFKFGDYIGAIQAFTEAVSLDELFADAYINRGAAKYRLERYVHAIEYYNLALSINNELINARQYKVRSQIMLGDTIGAISDCNSFVTSSPANPEAYICLELCSKAI